jgi:predicted MFS family arabinose efflux permease
VPIDGTSRWGAFFTLVCVGALMGVLYSAFTHFLPRYLDDAGLRPSGISSASFRTLLTGVVLLCGAVGQGVAGRLARPERLAGMLVLIVLANAPCLVWMAIAQGHARLWATCALAFVHFMHQPVYNSMVAQFVPSARRSLGYGFSNMMCFGIGAFGPGLAGYVRYSAGPGTGDRFAYAGLAVLAVIAAALAIVLWRTQMPEASRVAAAAPRTA